MLILLKKQYTNYSIDSQASSSASSDWNGVSDTESLEQQFDDDLDNMWMDNLERERQWALDHGLDQGLDRQDGQDRQDGLDQLIQDQGEDQGQDQGFQGPQERRYPSRKRQLTAQAAAALAVE